MGLLINNLNELHKFSFLIKSGFEYSPNSGPRGESGYTKTIHHNGNETLWITVSPTNNKVYLYNEWDIGGMLWDRTINIPDYVLNASHNEFINWLDGEIG